MPELINIKESSSVPATKFEVLLKKGSVTHNVSERLMNKLNIVDSSDYQENLTYVNEITLELNNEDGAMTNSAGTGLLDVDPDAVIECEVYCYMDDDISRDTRVKKFGGWLECNRVKPDDVKQTMSVSAYSYFGKAERLSGLNLVTRYFDSNGLILYNTGLFITRANISGKFLKNGIHTIYHRNAEGGVAGEVKLDDGDWIAVNFASLTIVSNKDGSQQVEIGIAITSLGAEGESRVVVKNEGDQYPYTYYFFGSAVDIIKKCFEVMGVNNMQVDDIEIPSHNGRRVLSWMPNFPGQNFFGYPNCIVSNGTDRIYLSITTTTLAGADLVYEIWEVNLTNKTFNKRYSTNLVYFDKDQRNQLELSEDGSRLYAYFDSIVEDTFVIKFNTTNWDSIKYPIDTNKYDWSSVHLVAKGTGGQVIFCGEDLDTGNKHVYVMKLGDTDEPGEIISVYQDNTIDPFAFQHVYYDGDDTWFYFVEEVSVGTWYLRRLKWLGGNVWDYEEVALFPVGTHPGNVRGYSYITKDRLALLSYGDDKAHIVSHTAKTITGNICPANWRLFSGWEEPVGSDRKLYVMSQEADVGSEEKLAYIYNDEFHFEENIPDGIRLIRGVDSVRKNARFCDAVDGSGNKIMLLASQYPGMLIRYANTFVPTIFGEYNTDGKTIRQVMQDIANNYLAFVRVDVNKKGFFIKRSTYSSSKTLKLKKDYIRSNIGEVIYSQKFDYVTVKTKNAIASSGDKAIDNKGKDVTLDLIPDGYAEDFAKWILQYYSKERRMKTFQYLPTYYEHEALDKVDMIELGIGSTGRIHSIAPTETEINLKVIYEVSGVPTEF